LEAAYSLYAPFGWISDELRDLIGESLQRRPESQWLFPTRNGSQVQTRYLRALVKRPARKAGVAEGEKVSPHTLRHTFATDLYRETKNLRLVQKAGPFHIDEVPLSLSNEHALPIEGPGPDVDEVVAVGTLLLAARLFLQSGRAIRAHRVEVPDLAQFRANGFDLRGSPVR